jgi:adenylate cyclase
MVDSGEEPKLGGIEENITAYFSDIQSFSSFSEKLSPSRLVELMNEYLTACTDIVQAEGGTLDKYIGDAVVAIYGAPLALPDHPTGRAWPRCGSTGGSASCAKKWRSEGKSGRTSSTPPDPHRAQHRARRRRQHGQPHAVQLHHDGRQREHRGPDGERCQELGRLLDVHGVDPAECERIGGGPRRLPGPGPDHRQGARQPLPIHELVALAEDATDKIRECIATFEQGLARYYARDWDGAIALFRRSEALEANGPEGRPEAETTRRRSTSG